MFDTEYHHGDSSGIELVLNRKAGWRCPWHVHTDHWTVGLVLSGTVSLATPNATRTLKKGQSFTVRPCEAHRLDIALESSLATLCLGTSHPATWPDFQGVPSLADPLSPDGVARLQDLASALASPAPPSPDTPVQALVRRLAEKPEEALSVTRMASLAGYSPWYFLRCFRKETGMTPHAFQLACRVRYARALLRKKTTAVEAAVWAGFADQSHMHKVFKLHHGLTPRQFLQASFKLARS